MFNPSKLLKNFEPIYGKLSYKNNVSCCPMSSCMKKIISKISGKIKKPQIAVLSLCGVIGKDSKFESALNYKNCAPLIKKAFEDKNTKAVAVLVNSPGGSPVQSEMIYSLIREESQKKEIPVFSFAQDVAASGGYMLLLCGDEIYAHPSSIIGSIGVIFSSFGFVDLIKKIGVDRRVYTEGKNKAILDPFLPEEGTNIEILKGAQKEIFDNFTQLVRLRREGKLKESEDKIFTGAFWAGKKSAELGLVDGVADFRKKMQEKFGENIEFVEIASKKSFLKGLFSSHQSDLAEKIINQIEEKVSLAKLGI